MQGTPSLKLFARRNVAASFALVLSLAAVPLGGCGETKKTGGGLSTSSSGGSTTKTTSSSTKSSGGGDIVSLGDAGPSCEEWPNEPQLAEVKAPADAQKPPADAQKAPNGIAYKILSEGDPAGAQNAGGGKDASVAIAKGDAAAPALAALQPRPTDTVSFHFTGWTKTGTAFMDATLPNIGMQIPAQVLNRGLFPKALLDALVVMKRGEKARFWVPAALGFGELTKKEAPCGDLVFDIELLDVTRPPDDAKTPPTTKTPGGVPYKVLVKGGGAAPKPNDNVTLHFALWVADTGQLVENTVAKGQPQTVRFSELPGDLKEAVGQMKVGDKIRVWSSVEKLVGQQTPKPINAVADIELIAAHP